MLGGEALAGPGSTPNPLHLEEEANGLRSALLISDRQKREWGKTLTAG
jgi:hypothetical protein